MTGVSAATVTPSMARALIDQARDKGYRPGVLGFRASVRDLVPVTFEHQGTPVRLVPCVSALAVREAILDRPEDGWLVIVTDRSDEDLGAGLLAQIIWQRLRPPDVWQAVQQRFAARGIDALLTAGPGHREVAAGLLEATPPEGWPPAPAGVLSRDHALGGVARRWLDLADGPVDLLGVLDWSTQRHVTARIADLRSLAGDPLADAVLAWLAGNAGAAAPFVSRLLAAGTLSDLVPLGLILDCLRSATDPDARVVTARLEHRWGNVPDAALAAVAASSVAVVSRLLADPRRVDDAGRMLGRADDLVAEVHGETLMAASDLLRSGLVQRLRRLATLLSHDPAGRLPQIEAAWASVGAHLLRVRDGSVPAFEAVVRLVRWLASLAADAGALDLAGLAYRQADSDAWVDAAINDAATGVEDRQLAAALEHVLRLVTAQRDEHDRQFARALAQSTAMDAGEAEGQLAHPSGPVHLVEKLLASVVFPIAKKTPALLLVLDGLSTGVATEMIGDVTARTDIAMTEALLPGHHRRGVGLAVLPTITEYSRTSLLCGALTTGQQNVEIPGYAKLTAAHGLGSSPLFHKKILETSRLGFSVSDEVRAAIDDVEHHRLVTCVLNTIDDALDRSDPSGTTWTADAVKHLVPLLQRAREARRVVLITSDHGHIVERRLGMQRSYPGGANTRHRPVTGAVEADEVLVAGRRVLTADHQAILAVSERLRYGPLKAGYHGGAAPAEVVVPVVLLVPSGTDDTRWQLAPPQEPGWWFNASTAPVVEVTVPAVSQPQLFEEPVEPVRRLGADLIASATYRQQRKLAGRIAITDAGIAALVDALSAAPNRRLTAIQAATVLSVPVSRVVLALGQVAKLLNVEGYAVVSVDPATQAVALDEKLLAEQYGLQP